MPSTEKSSLDISQSNSLAIHVTEQCNMRCSYCYSKSRRPGVVDTKDVAMAMALIKPERVFLYGGEALLHKSLVYQIIDSYPGVDFTIMTNGLLLDDDTMLSLIDRDVRIFLSLDSTTLAGNSYRNMRPAHFEKIVELLRRYCRYPKILLLNTVGPWTTDLLNFNQMADHFNVLVEYTPVMSSTPCNFWDTPFAQNLPSLPEEVRLDLTAGFDPSLRKPRLHIDGCLARDFKPGSISDMGHISQVTREMLQNYGGFTPTHCQGCSAAPHCQMMGMFPGEVDQFHKEGILQNTFGCQMARALSE